jgi:hypothetical protein
MYLTADGDMGFFDMERCRKPWPHDLASTAASLQVRMERYGLIRPEAKR